MRPETAELRIGPEPGQQIICHRCDRVVPAKALVEGFLYVVGTFLDKLAIDLREDLAHLS